MAAVAAVVQAAVLEPLADQAVAALIGRRKEISVELGQQTKASPEARVPVLMLEAVQAVALELLAPMALLMVALEVLELHRL